MLLRALDARVNTGFLGPVEAEIEAAAALLDRIEWRQIASLLEAEARDAVKKLTKRDDDREARYREFKRLMTDDPEFRALQHGGRAKRLKVSVSTIKRHAKRLKGESNGS